MNYYRNESIRSCAMALTSVASLIWSGAALAQSPPKALARPKVQASPRIDLDHILEGGVNRRGELVGLHHRPSAPRAIEFNEVEHDVYFRYTSPGEDDEVRTARVESRDPESGRAALSKFSTCYPESWTAEEIEAAIREAHDDAKARKKVDREGKWEGKTKAGVRIDGYLSRDGKWISTAFPVYTPPRRDRDTPRDRNAPADRNGSRP